MLLLGQKKALDIFLKWKGVKIMKKLVTMILAFLFLSVGLVFAEEPATANAPAAPAVTAAPAAAAVVPAKSMKKKHKKTKKQLKEEKDKAAAAVATPAPVVVK
jgi:hypothetical protein